MKSQLEQKLTYKALGVIYGNDALVEKCLEEPSAELKAKFKIKNVCTPLHGALVDRLDNTLSILRITKGEFLRSAIVEALDKADAIMEETGVNDYLESLTNRDENTGEAA